MAGTSHMQKYGNACKHGSRYLENRPTFMLDRPGSLCGRECINVPQPLFVPCCTPISEIEWTGTKKKPGGP